MEEFLQRELELSDFAIRNGNEIIVDLKGLAEENMSSSRKVRLNHKTNLLNDEADVNNICLSITKCVDRVETNKMR